MNIFVINSGSSSIKYQLINMPDAMVICNGIIDRIGMEDSSILNKTFKEGKEPDIKKNIRIKDHEQGLMEVAKLLTDPITGVIKDQSDIHIVGHRVVHGGENFSATTIITEEVKKKIKQLFSLAPLHNPLNYLGIEIAEKLFPLAKQVAVFDTAFHQTIQPVAYRYAIPDNLYREDGIRVYGFHGTSHKYVSGKAIKYLRKENSKIITIHLGNGCSITAVLNGKSFETSMGFGPMNGLIMGTRCGDIDQSAIFYLVNQLGYEIEKVNTLLNNKSGMAGLTGHSDMREIKAKIESDDREAKLAYNMYAWRVRKYIGAYTALLNGLDAIVFTGGVGENDSLMRKLCSSDMDFLGIQLDENKNESQLHSLREINSDKSPVKILVIPTNEELEIAQQCFHLLN
jgi:acetate kinase